MEYQNITNLLGTTPNEVPRSITKKLIEIMISWVMFKIDTNQANKSDLKHQCYNKVCVILVMHTLLLKKRLLLQEQILRVEKVAL